MDKKNDNIAKKMYIKILIVLFSVSAVVAIGGRIVKQILRGYGYVFHSWLSVTYLVAWVLMIGLILITPGPVPAERGPVATGTRSSERKDKSDMTMPTPFQDHHILSPLNNHQMHSDYAHRSKLEPPKKQTANCPLTLFFHHVPG